LLQPDELPDKNYQHLTIFHLIEIMAYFSALTLLSPRFD